MIVFNSTRQHIAQPLRISSTILARITSVRSSVFAAPVLSHTDLRLAQNHIASQFGFFQQQHRRRSLDKACRKARGLASELRSSGATAITASRNLHLFRAQSGRQLVSMSRTDGVIFIANGTLKGVGIRPGELPIENLPRGSARAMHNGGNIGLGCKPYSSAISERRERWPLQMTPCSGLLFDLGSNLKLWHGADEPTSQCDRVTAETPRGQKHSTRAEREKRSQARR
jgi:hypothetical protein